MKTSRRIIHIDMDCFYAAVEMRERPELVDRPLAVGGASGRGVLTTCNYAAREFGVRSGMPVFKAREFCPQLVIVPVRLELYKAASKAVRTVFSRYTDIVEPLSLDEAYLDVSHLKRPGSEIAQEIRDAIQSETELTASAGIGPNKLIAKIASDWNKPNGQCVVAPSKVDLFMSELSVRRIWGVGPKSSIHLAKHGIKTCAQLQTKDKTWLAQEFGSFGLELYDLCRGIDERPVEANRIRKSLSNEQTFTTNLETLEDCREALNSQHQELVEDLRKNAPDRKIAKLFVKLKFSDFRRTTAEMSGPQPELTSFNKLLKDAWGRSGESIRLMGIGVRFKESEGGSEQLELRI